MSARPESLLHVGRLTSQPGFCIMTPDLDGTKSETKNCSRGHLLSVDSAARFHLCSELFLSLTDEHLSSASARVYLKQSNRKRAKEPSLTLSYRSQRNDSFLLLDSFVLQMLEPLEELFNN